MSTDYRLPVVSKQNVGLGKKNAFYSSYFLTIGNILCLLKAVI